MLDRETRLVERGTRRIRMRWMVTRAATALAAAALVASCKSGDGVDSASDDDTTTAPGESSETTATSESDSPTPEPEPFEPREFTVVMNGDMLLHEGLWATAEIDAQRTGRGRMDFRPLLANMRPVISDADLAVCHMETPLAPRGGPFLGYPVFSVPPQIVPGLKWSGFDVCTTASNHSIDQGFDGLVRTIDDFDAAAMDHTGTFATKRASREPLIVDAGGVQVAIISATYGTNGIPLPDEAPWSVNLIKPKKIVRQAAQARDAGAEVVIVALHWGLEYTNEPTTDQIAVAETLTKSPDVDLVYGHHAHVVQPYDKVNGTWVLYGQGNAVAQQSTDVPGLYDGNTARVTFRETKAGGFRVAKLEYIPTMVTTFDGSTPMRYLNVERALEQPKYDYLDDELQATYERVTDIIGMEGAFKRGVTAGE
jgi:poly-gamma-glutamate capsule biosynthesis protein CapA/YwtB (metallophosphatase superfamily)